jgi:Flp pilus assembly pilin Flp
MPTLREPDDAMSNRHDFVDETREEAAERQATLVEYFLIVSLIAIVAVGVLVFFASQISDVLRTIAQTING